MLTAVADHFYRLALLVGIDFVPKQLGDADDRPQRVAQSVTHVCQKDALGLIRRFRPVAVALCMIPGMDSTSPAVRCSTRAEPMDWLSPPGDRRPNPSDGRTFPGGCSQ